MTFLKRWGFVTPLMYVVLKKEKHMDQEILKNINSVEGKIICLIAPGGIGKTVIINIFILK